MNWHPPPIGKEDPMSEEAMTRLDAAKARFVADYSEPSDTVYPGPFETREGGGDWIRVERLVQTKNGMLIRAEDGTFGLVKPVRLEEL